MDEVEELEPSELGSHEYWEKRYTEDIKNFKTHGDPGDIWFGEDSCTRIINWLLKDPSNKNKKLLDVGCGNGMLLLDLAHENFKNLHGIDYSSNAVDLAKEIALKKGVNINYATCDITKNLGGKFDIIHDKGTYDAICLSEDAKHNRKLYIENVLNALESNGYFIITSCNWTKDELDSHFKQYFTCIEIIPTPQFKFGGKIGNVVTSAVYKIKNK